MNIKVTLQFEEEGWIKGELLVGHCHAVGLIQRLARKIDGNENQRGADWLRFLHFPPLQEANCQEQSVHALLSDGCPMVSMKPVESPVQLSGVNFDLDIPRLFLGLELSASLDFGSSTPEGPVHHRE